MRQVAIVALLFVLCAPGAAAAMPIWPNLLTATTISSSQVQLSWDHIANEYGYYAIYRQVLPSTGACTPPDDIRPIAGATIIARVETPSGPPSIKKYMDNSLESDTSYCYAIWFFVGRSQERDEHTGVFGPSIATTYPSVVTAPTSTPTVTPTPTRTPTVTGTPPATGTPAPYYPATIAPPELQTLSDQCVVLDYHFMATSNRPWNKSPGALWTYSRWNLPPSESINQVFAFPSAGQYLMNIRASAPITSALVAVTLFSDTYSIAITRTSMASYAITVTVPSTESAFLRITAPTDSNITLDQVCLIDMSNVSAQALMLGGAAGNLGLGDLVDWFTPLELRQMFSNPFAGWNWDVTMSLVARIAMTLMVLTMPNLMQTYFAARIGMLALSWFFGFVAKRIGHPLPGGESSVVVLGRNTGIKVPKLPSLGPSGMRGGRSRRGRGI